MEKYKACVGWQNFTFMEEKDVTGVSPIQRNEDAGEKARYIHPVALSKARAP